MAVHRRLITSSLFGSATVSWQALAWFAPIGVLVVMLTIPTDGGLAFASAAWWSTAIAAQAIFTAIVLGLGWSTRAINRGWVRVAILLLAGGARGAFIGWTIGSFDLTTTVSSNIALRTLNSALVCALWVGAIGLLLQNTRDYREVYRRLVREAVVIHRAALEGAEPIDPVVIAHWQEVRLTLAVTAATAQTQLHQDRALPEDLALAAEVIASAVEQHVRPVSHGLWFGTTDEPPRLRFGALILECLRPWQLPLGQIMTIMLVVSAIGSTLRAGLFIGLLYALSTVCFAWLMLAGSLVLADRLPRHRRAVGIATLIGMPIAMFVASVAIGQGLMHLDPDLIGAAFGAVTSSVVVLGVLALHRMTMEQQLLLESLAVTIDQDALLALARRERIAAGDAAIGAYVHHSVQSELVAVAMRLGEAARDEDEERRSIVQVDARDRLHRLGALAAPWEQVQSPYAHLGEIAAAWAGIATIELALPPESDARGDQWQLAAAAIEEAVANAVRSGHAHVIRVEGEVVDGVLMIAVTDDGNGNGNGNGVTSADVRDGVANAAGPGTGLGTAWLERHLDGNWSRVQNDHGMTLRLSIR